MSTQLTRQACDFSLSYCKFGFETLLNLLNGFEGNIDGVIKNDDVECVHKTRVASRKIRAALPLFRFCFPSNQFKDWSKEIKKVTRLLGEARDLDVQIQFIEDYIQKIGQTDKKYIDLLLKDHKCRREKLQSSVTSGLDKLKQANVLTDITNFCQQSLAQQATTTFDPNQVLEKGYWHTQFRIDEFLSLRDYVHSPNENQKHHEMRISAKKLRYTMEFFAPLYSNGLKEEIETIKKYQDILGEKHDNEVWIDCIPRFIQKNYAKQKNKYHSKFKQALENFLVYIKDRREEQYVQFVDLWEKNQKSGFFDKLRESSQAGLTLSEKRIQQVLSNPDIVVGVISDVHANLQALERVFQDAEERGINVFLNAGDSIGYGACPNEVVELLCEKNVESILGNYDVEVIDGKTDAKGEKKIAWKFTKKELTKSVDCYLHALQRELRLEIAGKKVLVTHGSPESIEEHIYDDTPAERLRKLADCAKADLVIVGHSHEQFCKQAQGVRFVNPGSVGRPGDQNPQTAYAILSFNPFNVELVRLDYDVRAAANALRKKGLPESFSQMLLQGVELDAIIREDKEKEDNMLQDSRKIVEACKEYARSLWPDSDHSLQVSRVALELFDELIRVHKLGQEERCWLECAAILHDIGLSEGNTAHNKKSAGLILNDTELPFTSRERRIIASIARYHRKGLPKRKHYLLSPFDRKTIRNVQSLAALLRVADSLDYTHEAVINDLHVKKSPKKITIECLSEKKSLLEEQAFNKKKNLFEKVFGKKLVLQWKQL